MPCLRCGQGNPPGSRFCNACGRPLAAVREPVPAPRSAGRSVDDTMGFLERLPPFEEFTRDQLALLARGVRPRTLDGGEVLFKEGDSGGEMFFVWQGAIVISKAVTGSIEKVLARMLPGDFFGEMSLFGQLRRSATAQAEAATLLLGLDRESVLEVIALSPTAGLAFFTSLVQEFSRRLAMTDDLVAEVTRWGLEATGLDSSLGGSVRTAEEGRPS